METIKKITAGLYVNMRHKHPEWNIECDENAGENDIKIFGDVYYNTEVNINIMINTEPTTVDEFNNPYCFDLIIISNGASIIQGFECGKIGLENTYNEIIETIEETIDDIKGEGDIWPHMMEV